MFLFLFVLFSSCLTVYTQIIYNTLAPPEKRNATPENLTDIAQTCLLKPERGPCRAELVMYFFHAQHMNCSSTFKWGGCQGNGNRFDTEEECETKCFRARIKKNPDHCFLTFDYGYCFSAIKRWYYDRVYAVCKETIYSGCGGNKNRFETKDECDDTCIRDHRKPKYIKEVETTPCPWTTTNTNTKTKKSKKRKTTPP